MNFYYRFRIRERGFPPEIYRQISEMKPESRGKEDFIVEAKPRDDLNAALIKRLVDFCEEHSVPTAKIAGEFGAYNFEIVRHYEPDDLRAAPYLMPQTQKQMFRERLNRDSSGPVLLPASPSPASIKIASGMFNNIYVVSETVRKVLESGDLAGLFFRETVKKYANSPIVSPLWEIDSNIKLPKMVNSGLNPHSVVPCYWIDERPYRNGEPHYNQRDIEPLGEFDIARTFEQLGSEPALIVSQRFYQHCLKNKIPLEVRPARIDSD